MAEVLCYVCNNCRDPIEPLGSEVADDENGLTYHPGCYYLTTQPGERAWLQMRADETKGRG